MIPARFSGGGMKDWLEKIRKMKGSVWIAALLLCAVSAFLLSSYSPAAPDMTEEERRVSATLSKIAGAGQTRISIFYVSAASAFGGARQTPAGALIVSQGAGDAVVRLRLLRAAEALLGLESGAVEVFPMEEAQ